MNPDHAPIPTEVLERVAKGATLLDEKKPDWFRTVFDWANFDIRSVTNCLLGQVFRSEPGQHSGYDKGVHAVLGDDYALVTRYGYANGVHESRHFKQAWMDEVQKRLDQNVQPEPESELPTITLNPTEKELLIELLTAKLREVEDERAKLKTAYKTFLDPTVFSTRALLVAVRDAK